MIILWTNERIKNRFKYIEEFLSNEKTDAVECWKIIQDEVKWHLKYNMVDLIRYDTNHFWRAN